MSSIGDIRREYKLRSLNEDDLPADPLVQFGIWWQEAVASEIVEVNAMTLSTIDADGRPQGRIVLMKHYDERGFVFYTNYKSSKAKELEINPFASLLFFWKELERQVRIGGSIEKVPAEESDVYFQSRPVGSQLGAIASPQSQPIENREVLENKMLELEKAYSNRFIPRPAHWGGYLVKPDYYEFWQGRPNRLHDRIAFAKNEDDWQLQRLAP